MPLYETSKRDPTPVSLGPNPIAGWHREGHNDDVTMQKEQHRLSFMLQTIRIGINATWIVVAGLAFYLLFSTNEHTERPRFLTVLAVALVGALVVALLPWSQLLQSRWGWPALYAWSALDIVLITVLIDASGAQRSVLFVMYALTTVFFSASYPRVAQWALLLFTLVTYIAAAAVSGWELDEAAVVLRFAVLGSLMYVVSYLSGSLLEQNTELERREEHQRRTSEELLQVQRFARLGSWVYRPESGEFQWSEELRKIFGAPAGEDGIAFFMQAVHPEDRPALERALAAATRGGPGFIVEHRILRPDGSTRFIQAQGQPEEGVTPRTILGTALDVTERKKAEEYEIKLRELESNRQHALQINDNIVQGLTVAKYAVEMGRLDLASEALHSTLASAKHIVRDLLSEDEKGVREGSLVRTEPAVLRTPTGATDADEGPASASTA